MAARMGGGVTAPLDFTGIGISGSKADSAIFDDSPLSKTGTLDTVLLNVEATVEAATATTSHMSASSGQVALSQAMLACARGDPTSMMPESRLEATNAL